MAELILTTAAAPALSNVKAEDGDQRRLDRLWEGHESCGNWLRLGDLGLMWKGQQDEARVFAARQVAPVDDRQGGRDPWRVHAIGQFPELTWDLQLFVSTNGYFPVKAKGTFLSACQSRTDMRLSTRS